MTERLPTVAAAAADKMDNFQPVAFFERSMGPTVAGHDIAIQFDRYTVGLHTEGFDESGESEGERGTTKVPLFAIEVEFHLAFAELFFAPSGLVRFVFCQPTACAVGCILSPLRGYQTLSRFCGFRRSVRNPQTRLPTECHRRL